MESCVSAHGITAGAFSRLDAIQCTATRVALIPFRLTADAIHGFAVILRLCRRKRGKSSHPPQGPRTPTLRFQDFSRTSVCGRQHFLQSYFQIGNFVL